MDALDAEGDVDQNRAGSSADYISSKYRIMDTRMGQAQILMEVSFDQADWYPWASGYMLDEDTEDIKVLNMSIVRSVGEGPWNSLEMELQDDLTELVNMTGWTSTQKRFILPIRTTYCWDVMS